MKRQALRYSAAILLLALSACGTVSGLGRDISAASDYVADKL